MRLSKRGSKPQLLFSSLKSRQYVRSITAFFCNRRKWYHANRHILTASVYGKDCLWLENTSPYVRSLYKTHSHLPLSWVKAIIPGRVISRVSSSPQRLISEVREFRYAPPSVVQSLGRLNPGRWSLTRYCNIEELQND
jgi:hypothetical protein